LVVIKKSTLIIVKIFSYIYSFYFLMIEKYNLLLKICGITNLEDAEILANHPIDYLGFVFYYKSPRTIDIKIAKKIYEERLLNSKKEKLNI
jgi:hypothetical protein